MTRALSASFKSQMLALADRTHLEPGELVLAALEIAARNAAAAGHDRATLHSQIDLVIVETAPNLAGAQEAMDALRGDEEGGPLNG